MTNIQVKDAGISSLPIYIDTRHNACIYSELEAVGAPIANTVHLLPGQQLDGKIYDWLKANWMTNMSMTKILVSILVDYNSGDIRSLPIRSLKYQSLAKGILRFMHDEQDALLHLYPIFFPDLTLAGTPVPKISKTFNDMSFAERQAILKSNNEARLELVDPSPKTNP